MLGRRYAAAKGSRPRARGMRLGCRPMTTLEELHAGLAAHGGTRAAVRARADFARLVWNRRGQRRLPSLAALDSAINAMRRGDLEWLCEFNPLGPIYLLPNTRWIKALVDELRRLEVRRVVEVGAGDGFLSKCLAKAAPELEVIATDSHEWAKAEARMTEAEQRAHENVAGIGMGADVLQRTATEAVEELKPDLVLASWLPPGPLLDEIIRANVTWVLDVGAAGGVTTSAWSWRFDHDLLEGPLERFGRCRLDERPAKALQTRVTLYRGATHPDHHEETVEEGDWLWQFRPVEG